MPPSVRVRFRAFTNKPPQMLTAKLVAGAIALERVWAQRIISLLRKYPPQVPNQSYIRTGKLGASWDIVGPRVTPSGVVVDIVNYAVDKRGKRYATYVQGEWQVPIHEGRWLRADDPDALNRQEFRRQLRSLVLSSIKAPRT